MKPSLKGFAGCLLILGFGGCALGAGQDAYVLDAMDDHRFALVGASGAVPVLVEQTDHEVVRVAAMDLTLDVERVTGKRPALWSGEGAAGGIPSSLVIVGSMDRSELVAGLVQSGKLDAEGVRGEWEAFTLQHVKEPFPGVREALVIAGSDRRGTAYGVYELSRRIGVSPWHWWADVTPVRMRELHLLKRTLKVGPPGVKYRGIFINDEMWGIRPWAEGTFSPGEGRGLGPRTHARIFELLLRLRANYFWPAMHRGTEPFHSYPGNKLVADRYAIVMGASHIEPMQRNNMHGAEWDREDGGEWNYQVNRDAIYAYWERGVKQYGRYENVYTIGMRGKDDEPMEGGDTQAQKIALLEKVIADQRRILADHVNPEPAKVPQVFIPYTEVLGLYDAGMKLPGDVTICWPDDNFGYIRRLPTAGERQRPGGSGIYYHLQWLNGATTAYTWLNTMPPSLIFTEMNKAWQHGCRQLWVLNVGDIKPMEIGMDFFLEMAWDPDRWTHDGIGGYLEQWARRDLDDAHAAEIAGIMKTYYQLALQRRPEHLLQQREGKPMEFSWFSHRAHNDEAARRLAQYEELCRRAEAVYGRLSKERRDAYFQLVLYPVQCAALMNRKIIHADRSLRDAALGSATARRHAHQARVAAQSIIGLTEHYNEGLETVGEKWRHMMHWAPGPWGRQRHQFEMPPTSEYDGSGKPSLLVVAEGSRETSVPDLSIYTRGRRFIDLFNTGRGWIQWQAETAEPWLKLNQSAGCFREGCRLWVEVDWGRVPRGITGTTAVTITSNAGEAVIQVPVFAPGTPLREELQGHVESHGCVSMEAEHYSRGVERGGGNWLIVDNLGRSGDSVVVHPATLPSRVTAEEISENSPSLEYDFHAFSTGQFLLHLDCLPTLPVSPGRGVRLAVSLDGGEPRLVGATVAGGLRKWDVLQNLRRWQTTIQVDEPGKHTLSVWMVDPGVILDRIVIWTGEPVDSYLGPPESFLGKAED